MKTLISFSGPGYVSAIVRKAYAITTSTVVRKVGVFFSVIYMRTAARIRKMAVTKLPPQRSIEVENAAERIPHLWHSENPTTSRPANENVATQVPMNGISTRGTTAPIA